MADTKQRESYYEILKVPTHASVSEIVSAYNNAKNAFSRDSVATYSLFSQDEIQDILGKLEQAYLTLSNIEKKREYDRRLADQGDIPDMEVSHDMSLSPIHTQTTTSQAPAIDAAVTGEHEITQVTDAGVTGAVLSSLREKRGLSIDDVARVTKIPSKFIRAIETENPATMPARVYVQGFVKNLANLYKIDAAESTKSYLAHIDKPKQTT